MSERIVAYARVSSREQAEDFHALEQQTARLEAAGATEIFTDVESGSKNDRARFNELISLVQTKQVDKVIATRIDRLTRSLPKLREFITLFDDSGVNLVILDQNIDLSTAQGKLMVNILGAVAEWETDLLSERVKHGKQHQRNQGKACAAAPWGYTVVNGKYILDESRFLCLIEEDRPDNYLAGYEDKDGVAGRTVAFLAKESIDIYLQHKSVRRSLAVIFEKYGVKKTTAKRNSHDKVFYWTQTGFCGWVTNPVLSGHTAYLKKDKNSGLVLRDPTKWMTLENTHTQEKLITDEEAEQIKLLFQINLQAGPGSLSKKATPENHYREYTYQKSIIFCGECNSKCTSKTCDGKKRLYNYYACRYAKLGCSNSKSISKEKIEDGLIKALLKKSLTLARDKKQQSENTSLKSDHLVHLEAKLEALNNISWFDPDIEDVKQKLQKQIDEETNPFLGKRVKDSTEEDILRAGNNLAFWHILSNDEKVDVYFRLVSKIFIRNGEVESVTLKI